MKNLEMTARELEQEFGVTVLPVVCDVAKEEDIDNFLLYVTKR